MRLFATIFLSFYLLSNIQAQNADYSQWIKKERAAKSNFLEQDKGIKKPEQRILPSKTQSGLTADAANKAKSALIDKTASSPFYQFVKRSDLLLFKTKDAMKSNFVGVINDGQDALILRLHLIRNAKRSINIQTFIYHNDECGRLIMHELIKAAQRGVKVKLIADHFASDQNRDLVAFLTTVSPNLKIKHYRPVADRLEPSKFQSTLDSILPTRTNQRMHNKLFLVDDLMAITGGRNIENCYYNFATGMNLKDRDAILIGPVALDCRTAFDEFWNYKHSVKSTDLADIKKALKKNNFPRYKTRDDFALGGLFKDVSSKADDNNYIDLKFAKRLIQVRQVVLLTDKPGKNRKIFWMSGKGRITKQLVKIIASAEHKLLIQTPYLVLDHETRKLFAKLKKAKKKLQIVVSSNSYSATDNIIAYSANYRLRSAYIENCGLEIYEYMPHPGDLLRSCPSYPELAKRAKKKNAEKMPFLCIHAKSFVIDDQHTFIGSYNLDPRSANLNTEIGFLIDDPLIAAIVSEDIIRDCQPENSWVVNKRPMPLNLDAANRLIEGTLRLTPLDIWPIRNTTCYELIPGKTPVRPYDDTFYENYRDAGAFPGAPKGLSEKALITKMYKVVGSSLQHLF